MTSLRGECETVAKIGEIGKSLVAISARDQMVLRNGKRWVLRIAAAKELECIGDQISRALKMRHRPAFPEKHGG